MNRPYTRQELEQAIRLHDEGGLTWPEVAVALDRPVGSLNVTVHRFRAGKWATPTRDRTARIDAEIERLIEAGTVHVRTIAAAVGLHHNNVYYRLARLGFDRETLREAAEIHSESSPKRMRAEMRAAPPIGSVRAAA